MLKTGSRSFSPGVAFLLLLPLMGSPGLIAKRLGAPTEVAYAIYYVSTLAVLVFGYWVVLSGNAGVNYWAKSGAMERVQRHLNRSRKGEDRANWRIPVSGLRPLHMGAAAGHAQVVRLLLERGAKPNVRDWRGQTPLHKAASGGHLPVAEALLASGADASQRDKRGRTAAELALAAGHAEVARRLSDAERGPTQSS